MPNNEELPTLNSRFKQIGSIVLASTLFLGGILLLSLHLPGWSLILGLPAVQIGIVFLIFSLFGLPILGLLAVLGARMAQRDAYINGFREGQRQAREAKKIGKRG